ncbi:alpha-hydroxy-acid oxidizing protein [Methylobacterium nodulans]|uniref:alpha-hydroxy-acid oxidizing protein n=1 Tax=Methylobacterium nodulans TaxID=114616 RepID=UPI000161891A
MRKHWKDRLVIKGLLHPKDVTTAREVGADGVILPNHGGRQLDGAVSPMRALPAAVKLGQISIASERVRVHCLAKRTVDPIGKVFRLDRIVLTARPLGLVVGPLTPQAPLPLKLLRLRLGLGERGNGDRDLVGRERGEQDARD